MKINQTHIECLATEIHQLICDTHLLAIYCEKKTNSLLLLLFVN